MDDMVRKVKAMQDISKCIDIISEGLDLSKELLKTLGITEEAFLKYIAHQRGATAEKPEVEETTAPATYDMRSVADSSGSLSTEIHGHCTMHRSAAGILTVSLPKKQFNAHVADIAPNKPQSVPLSKLHTWEGRLICIVTTEGISVPTKLRLKVQRSFMNIPGMSLPQQKGHRVFINISHKLNDISKIVNTLWPDMFLNGAPINNAKFRPVDIPFVLTPTGIEILLEGASKRDIYD